MKGMIIVRVIYVLLAILVILPEALWAQSKETPATTQNSKYFVVRLGEYLPQSSDLSNLNAKNGFAGQAAFGYYPLPYVAVEVGFGYFETKGSVSNIDRKFSAWPLEMSGRLLFPISFLEPYLLAGVGAYFARSEIGNLEKNSIDFGYFGGGGLNFNLGKNYFIGAEARYLVVKVPVATVATPSGTVSASDVNLDGVTVMGQFGFRF